MSTAASRQSAGGSARGTRRVSTLQARKEVAYVVGHGFGFSSLVLTLFVMGVLGCGKSFDEQEDLPNAFELPAGTEILVRPVSDLTPADMKVDREFAGVLAAPLYYKREKLDTEGRIFHDEVLIAPEGAVVKGKVVSEDIASDTPTPDDGERIGLQLSQVTLHGGMSFDIVTDRVFEFGADSGKPQDVSSAQKADVVAFKLVEPADVALVIDLRDKEEQEKEDARGEKASS